ncbi:putative ACT domain-containing protein ACR1-12 [Helianthus anomalus]
MKCLEAAVERRVCEGTRLELCANNRVGLLSDITRVLRENGIVVLRADLATKTDKSIVDITFYVRDIVGNNVDVELVKSMKREMGLIDLAVKNEKVVKPSPAVKPRFSIGDIFKSQIEMLSHILLTYM